MRRIQVLLIEYAEAIEAIVRRTVPDEMDRDDLRQEIAIALWRAMPKFKGDASERTYVLRIAQNRAITFRLRQARKRALFAPLESEPSVPSHSGEHDLRGLHQRIADAAARLSDVQRETLTLAAAGMTPQEIAAHTGRTAGAVRVALHRAREAVRRWIGGRSE